MVSSPVAIHSVPPPAATASGRDSHQRVAGRDQPAQRTIHGNRKLRSFRHRPQIEWQEMINREPSVRSATTHPAWMNNNSLRSRNSLRNSFMCSKKSGLRAPSPLPAPFAAREGVHHFAHPGLLERSKNPGRNGRKAAGFASPQLCLSEPLDTLPPPNPAAAGCRDAGQILRVGRFDRCSCRRRDHYRHVTRRIMVAECRLNISTGRD